MEIGDMVRDEIRGLYPYEVPQFSGRVKLDAMESPYDLPPSIKKRILEEIEGLPFNRYPDPMANSLREELSAYLGIQKDMILVGNGSDELILTILLTFGNDWVIYPEPSFPMYGILAKITGKEGIGIPLKEDLELDLPSFLKMSHGGVVFIAYPNNPTGNLFDQDAILSIIEDGSSIVVLDEAYYEFSKETFLPFLKRYQNLIILRTFSKAFSLAGARVGYLLANQELIEILKKVKLPYNLNAISQLVATLTLRFRSEVDDQVLEIIREREKTYMEMKDIKGIIPYRSKTNFIFFKVKGLSSNRVFEGLKRDGILIRCIDGDSLRVTIGRPDENLAFLNGLRRLIERDEEVL